MSAILEIQVTRFTLCTTETQGLIMELEQTGASSGHRETPYRLRENSQSDAKHLWATQNTWRSFVYTYQ